jgi:hypothetical protein
LTLEAIVTTYAWHAQTGQKPILRDHGVPSHEVFKRVSAEDFAGFYKLVVGAAKLAREALDAFTVGSSANKWRNLFGSKFPPPPGGDDDGDDDDDGGKSKGSGGPGILTAGMLRQGGSPPPVRKEGGGRYA